MYRRLSLVGVVLGTAVAAAAFMTQVTIASLTFTAPAATPSPTSTAQAASAAPPQVDTIAHRGGAAYAPENTLAACALARAQGADVCEFDIQQTKDNQLVLIHDPTLARTTNVEEVFPGRSPWNVADFTLAEIRRLDAGSWFSSRFRGEGVPTLAEGLRQLEDGTTRLLLEVKHSVPGQGIDLRVAAELQDTRFWWQDGRLTMMAFDWPSMRGLHLMVPDVPIALLGKPDVGQLPELARYAGRITLPHAGLTAQYVQEVHDQGMRVYTWTANKPALIRRLLSYGVDGIMTNKPDRLQAVKGPD
ncbi:glycerophosphodiester phosphodiesterase family protein [Nonomuraea pusilla]|uniref:glycerophosphodiester phosphodiesterase n=1 Tax=Nonomuraea pusilla TaxID=46177 RepID=UPI00331972A7